MQKGEKPAVANLITRITWLYIEKAEDGVR